VLFRHYIRIRKVTASQEDKDRWLFQKNEDYLSYLVDMDESEILPGVLQFYNF
jgi:beta-phosphoglucomutase